MFSDINVLKFLNILVLKISPLFKIIFFSQQRLLIRSYNTVTLTIFFINANIANRKYTTQLQNILMGYCVVFCSLGRVCETLT